ncbi:gas vesicle protein [Actinocrinis sp.]|uniref:gas vesicle protein n=1 Tax=Actinocrinis sp. TaxID=1920516 RepID=UPI002C204EF6|nr:gas vesicle protein [Actinocrinis sp.]HXR69263.1 gas vesicle protein [Actinocrinis sp.]
MTLAPDPFGSGLGGGQAQSADRATNLGDILERVLDKGLVIAGDIRVNLLDIELLTIKLRLVIASLETAKEVGIDWWEHDPWLRGDAERRELAQKERGRRELTAAEQTQEQGQRAHEEAEEEPEPRRARRGKNS